MGKTGAIPVSLGLTPVASVLVWAALLIVAVAVGGGALLAYRRRLFARDAGAESGILNSLRGMRDRGQITQAEFDAARKRMAARVAGVAPPPSAVAAPRTPDAGARVAKPGLDLTGAPLPRPRETGADETPDKPGGGAGGNPRGR